MARPSPSPPTDAGARRLRRDSSAVPVRSIRSSTCRAARRSRTRPEATSAGAFSMASVSWLLARGSIRTSIVQAACSPAGDQALPERCAAVISEEPACFDLGGQCDAQRPTWIGPPARRYPEPPKFLKRKEASHRNPGAATACGRTNCEPAGAGLARGEPPSRGVLWMQVCQVHGLVVQPAPRRTLVSATDGRTENRSSLPSGRVNWPAQPSRECPSMRSGCSRSARISEPRTKSPR